MANLGISPTEVLQTLKGQNASVYSGYYISGDQRIRVSVNDRFKDVEDIANLMIGGHEGDLLRLKDIAKVERGYAEPTRNAMLFDGTRAIGLSISALSGSDITKVGREVERTIKHLMEHRVPVGVECNKVFFQPELVEKSIGVFIINLIESILIVTLVLMFAMGLRSGLLLGATLVVTVLGSLLFLNMFDGTLQRVSLGAFILAMGMLVDNAIVIVDGVLIDMGRGRLRSRSLTEIGRKTAMPLLGATLIAILAFLPLFLSPDTTGVYIRDLFIVLSVSLLLSWVLSLTMVPLLAKVMLKNPATRGGEGSSQGRLVRALNSTLMWGLRNRTLSLAIAISLVVGCGMLYKVLPQSFFPNLNYNQLYIEYKLPESSDSEQTMRDLESITQHLMAMDDVEHVTASLGGTPTRYNLVRSIAIPSITYGDLIVEFKDIKSLVGSIPDLQQYLTDNYPQSYVRVKRYNLMYNRYPIEATFSGPDPDVLRGLCEQAQRIMEGNDDIMLVTSDWDAKVPVLEVEYNQALGRELGLSRQDIAISLLAANEGIPAETIFEGDNRHGVVVRCVDKGGDRIEKIESTPLFPIIPSINGISKESVQGLMSGALSTEDLLSNLFSTTPLAQAIDGVELKWIDPVVIRLNGERAMRAQSNNIPSIGAEDARVQIAEAIEAIELPEGYSLEWKGEYETKNKSMRYLFKNLPLAIALMIGVLILLFRDYRKPLIILLCVPLLFVGAVLGVFVSGKSFGFVAICGVLGLIGMMIKNGVVLMDEIASQLQSGKDPVKALIDSSDSRFRPIMMASITTILGMIPLLFDDMFGSLAATIMGGLFVGTIVTLIFIPILYAVFFNIKVK